MLKMLGGTIIQLSAAIIGMLVCSVLLQLIGHFAAPLSEVVMFSIISYGFPLIVASFPNYSLAGTVMRAIGRSRFNNRLAGVVGLLQGFLLNPLSFLVTYVVKANYAQSSGSPSGYSADAILIFLSLLVTVVGSLLAATVIALINRVCYRGERDDGGPAKPGSDPSFL